MTIRYQVFDSEDVLVADSGELDEEHDLQAFEQSVDVPHGGRIVTLVDGRVWPRRSERTATPEIGAKEAG
jgi:hypothetical protein